MATASRDAALYGQPRPNKRQQLSVSSSGSLAFTSQLSALISATAPQPPSTTSQVDSQPSQPRRKKQDIFSTHNRNTALRAQKDLASTSPANTQQHSTTSTLDNAAWHRSKRRMEEKARLYSAMKRGDVDDTLQKHMVDFDRKWADKNDDGQQSQDESDGDDDIPSEEEEEIEWIDEFGRSRKTTRAQAAREQRQSQTASSLESRARPAAPTKLIYGDTVQDAAFNPELSIADKMADLASKRDKSLTPPPETHFDATQENRDKGVGFMHFSRDESERQGQMSALERQRIETERVRADHAARLSDRKAQLEQRRAAIHQQRQKRTADALNET